MEEAPGSTLHLTVHQRVEHLQVQTFHEVLHLVDDERVVLAQAVELSECLDRELWIEDVEEVPLLGGGS